MHAVIYNAFAYDTIDMVAVKRMTQRCRAIQTLAGDDLGVSPEQESVAFLGDVLREIEKTP
jgi:hypothetical protein